MGIAVISGEVVHHHSIWRPTIWVLDTMISSMFVCGTPYAIENARCYVHIEKKTRSHTDRTSLGGHRCILSSNPDNIEMFS
jgi:hypothetical protein